MEEAEEQVEEEEVVDEVEEGRRYGYVRKRKMKKVKIWEKEERRTAVSYK